MPTFDETATQVGQETGNSSWAEPSFIRIGQEGSGVQHLGFRVASYDAANGSTHSTGQAVLGVADVNSSAAPAFVASLEDSDDAAALASGRRPSQLTLTTANNSYDAGDFTAGNDRLVDFVAALDEVCARGGWSADNAIVGVLIAVGGVWQDITIVNGVTWMSGTPNPMEFESEWEEGASGQLVEPDQVPSAATVLAPGLSKAVGADLAAGPATVPDAAPRKIVRPGLATGPSRVFEVAATDKTVAPGLIDGPAEVFSSTLTESIAAGLVPSVATVPDVGVRKAVAPEAVAGPAQVLGADLLEVVAADLVPGNAQLFSPSLSGTSAINPDLIAGPAQLFTPSVSKRIDAELVASSAAVPDVTLSKTVSTGLVSGNAQVLSNDLLELVSPDLITGPAQLFDPNLAQTGSVLPALIVGPAQVFTATVSKSLAVDLVPSSASVPAASLGKGVVSELVASNAVVLAPTVIGGASAVTAPPGASRGRGVIAASRRGSTVTVSRTRSRITNSRTD